MNGTATWTGWTAQHHKLLIRQLRTIQPLLAKLEEEDQHRMRMFLAAVDDAYRTYDDDRDFLERSMELSSTELFNANKETQAQNIKLKELQMAAEKLRYENALILDSVREGIVRLDVEGRVTFANRHAIQMAGRDEGEVLGRPIHDVFGHIEFGGSRCSGTSCSLDGVLREGVVRHADNESFAQKDGTEFPVEYTAAPIREGDAVVGIVIVFKDISSRKRLQREYLDAAHQAGMAEIAIGVLHNVGNILNSVNVGAEQIQRITRSSNVDYFKKANSLLQQNREGWGEFLLNHPKGSKLADYYVALADAFAKDCAALREESDRLLEKIELIKHVVEVQQRYAKGGELKEQTSIHEAVESVLTIQQQAFLRHDIKVVRRFRSGGLVMAQRAQLVHVLLNLVKNATEAMAEANNEVKELTIATIAETRDDGGGITIEISDTGSGITAANLPKIFGHGFTTKSDGHGFGLHYCANALREMGATITVHSEGHNKGATFRIAFARAGDHADRPRSTASCRP